MFLKAADFNIGFLKGVKTSGVFVNFDRDDVLLYFHKVDVEFKQFEVGGGGYVISTAQILVVICTLNDYLAVDAH